MALHPDSLPRAYLLTNFDRLVNDSGETLLRLLRVLHGRRPDVFRDALTRLADAAPLTLHSLELTYNLALGAPIEQRHLDAFVHRWFAACKEMEGAARQKHLRLICKFAVELMRRERFDAATKAEVWLHYCAHFAGSGVVAEFRDALSRTLAKTPAN